MIPCSSSAASSGIPSPNARKQIAKAAAFLSQSTSDHPSTPAKRPGLLSTERPSTIPSEARTMRSARRPGSRRRDTRSTSARNGPGRLATNSAIPSTTPNSAAVVAAIAERDFPPQPCDGNDGIAIATAIRPSMMSASNSRSTPIDPSAVAKRTGNCRDAMKPRATSPARAGSRLFAMKPIVVACHSGAKGRGRPS